MIELLSTYPLAEFLTFLAAGILLNLTPGADVVFAVGSGLSGGPRTGAMAGLGVGLGGLWHAGLAALGVSALLAASPAAFTVLATRWRCADDVDVEQHTIPGATDPSAILLRQGRGLRRQLALSTVTAAYVSVCDGDLTAGAAAAAIAGLLDLDDDAVRAEVVALTREAAKDGLLLR